MLHLRSVALVLLLSLGSALPGQSEPAQKPEDSQKVPKQLGIGDMAPPLAIEKWIKGEPIQAFEKGKVYVVEFWATWCGPCISGMPHLTKLQKKYEDKGLRIIGVTSEDPRGNTLEAVKKLVTRQGDEKMGYSVAWDKGSTTNDAYMEAAGQNGIPCAFVVDGEGRVAYIGHPMAMDKPLEAIVAGKYDLAKARESSKLMAALQASFQQRDWQSAVKGIDALIAVDASRSAELLPQKFFILLLPMKEPEKAYAFGRELLEKQLKDEHEALNALAWSILDEGEIEKRDFDLALAMASRASELTKGLDPAVLDTLALAYHKKGNSKKALEVQKKAIEIASEDMKEPLSERLKVYEEAVGNGADGKKQKVE